MCHPRAFGAGGTGRPSARGAGYSDGSLFCWTGIGAEYVGVESPLITCRLYGIDPNTYLVDVLQRASDHPAAEVELLTAEPRRVLR